MKIKIKNNMGLPKTKLQQIAEVERIVELARNDYNSDHEYDITQVPMTNGVDIGLPADIAERATELARNVYNKSNQYDSSKV